MLLDDAGNWGKISLERFNAWLDWLHSNSAPFTSPFSPARAAAAADTYRSEVCVSTSD